MLKVLGAFVAVVLAIFMEGLRNLSLGDMLLILAVPIMFVYKLLGNRPAFLIYVGIFCSFLGGWAFLWGYIVVPTQYYYSVWGWPGIVGGVVAAILLPLQLLMFFAVAYFKGGAAEYIGKFLSGVFFSIAGLMLWFSSFSASPWERFRRRNAVDPEA